MATFAACASCSGGIASRATVAAARRSTASRGGGDARASRERWWSRRVPPRHPHHRPASPPAPPRGGTVSARAAASPARRRVPPRRARDRAPRARSRALARASVAGASSPPAPERDDDDAESPPSLVVRLASAATGWLASNYFLVGMLSSVALASLCPGLGATGGPLRPEITVNVIAVRLMFLISGFNLPTSELRASVANVRANALIQSFVFGVAGFVVAFAVKPALIAHFAFDPRLANGLVVLACLPTTIGSGVALTNAAGGSVGVALFHAVFSNLAGVALSPALIFAYLGAELGAAPGSAPVSTRAAIAKLGSQVLVPVVIGMAVRASARFGPALASAPAKARLKLASDGVILAIVYNTFCNTFASGFGVPASEITALFFVLSSLLCAYKAAIFLVARYVARLSPEDVVAATFMGSQKTLAFGLPLVKALFDGNPDLAWLCLPTLVYHPMQIALGSALVPKLRAFAAKGGDAEKGGASPGG